MASIAYELTATATPDNDAYTDGDVVGGLLDFGTQAGTLSGGVLSSVVMTDDDNEGAALDLWLFDGEPSTIADDAAFAPTAADLKKLITKVAIASGDYATENSLKWVNKEDINVPVSSKHMWGYLVCNGSTPTYASGKTLYIRLLLVA